MQMITKERLNSSGSPAEEQRSREKAAMVDRPELKKSRKMKTIGATTTDTTTFTDTNSSTGSVSSTLSTNSQRWRRTTPTHALRDYEAATSVLEASRRVELARQRSHVSFGQRKIDLGKTFRTAPESRARIVLDSPPGSPDTNAPLGDRMSLLTAAQTMHATTTRRYRPAITLSPTKTTDSDAKKTKKIVSFDNGHPAATQSTTGACQHDHVDVSTSDVSKMLSPIHAACRKGDYLVLKHLLSFYYGNECYNLVNSACSCGMTPLQVACDHGHVRVARLLLRRHAQPNKCGAGGSKKRHHTCMAMACLRRNLELVELLLQYGAVIDEEALVGACKLGFDDVVRVLTTFRPNKPLSLELPAPTTSSSSSKRSATDTTTTNDGKDEMLIDPHILHKAVFHAAINDHPEIVRLLLGDGKTPTDRAKILTCAVEFASYTDSHHKMMRCLARVYDPQSLVATKDAQGSTLLHHVVKQDNTKSALLLTRLGADVNARDGGRITALYIACARGQAAIVRGLLQAGARCVSMGPNGETPLHIAAQENHLSCVEMLLKHGRAKVDEVTMDQCTALHLASQRGNTQVAELLLQHGANIDAMTQAGETPLVKASRMSQFETVKLLVARNANTHPKQSKENTNYGSNRSSLTGGTSKEDLKRGGSSGSNQEPDEDQIFIAKTNTHTSLKRWLKSVMKSH